MVTAWLHCSANFWLRTLGSVIEELLNAPLRREPVQVFCFAWREAEGRHGQHVSEARFSYGSRPTTRSS